MSDLWVVIPAAGVSQRFREAGYDTPKPLLKIQDISGVSMLMVNHVIHSLPPSTETYHIIVALPARNNVPFQDCFFQQRIIDKTTGQADTIYQMIQELPAEDSALVLDCDMVLETKDISRLMELIGIYDVALAVTKTFDPNASRVDQVPYPTRFVEKEPISEYGIVGARAFKNIGLLSKALKKTIDRYKTLGQEPYLSVAINHYPGTKFAHEITEYDDWGTPERITASGAKIVS